MCGPHHRLGRDAFASGPEILRRLLQLHQNASILEQGCADFSPGSVNRCDQFTRHPGRTSSPLRPRLSCRHTQSEAETLGAFIIENLGAQIGESLRRSPRILPFCKDCRWRLDLITTAARAPQSFSSRPLLEVSLEQGM